jgi:hypothetical protein
LKARVETIQTHHFRLRDIAMETPVDLILAQRAERVALTCANDEPDYLSH